MLGNLSVDVIKDILIFNINRFTYTDKLIIIFSFLNQLDIQF